ncbi:hypothetical protein CCACVL1_12152 [Corchorus capsularis]|uniref:Uncharacterized protein n=1 Tax=Corchorus capsularis TaxID=210143 RepID=A0A1R3IH15_COCAP|nr:hypothetical protein CCACVL1_12152 [Corchorus capsularis]
MAAPFSPTTPVRSIFRPHPNPTKSFFLSPSDCFQKGFNCVKCHSSDVNVYSWSSAANYTPVFVMEP